MVLRDRPQVLYIFGNLSNRRKELEGVGGFLIFLGLEEEEQISSEKNGKLQFCGEKQQLWTPKFTYVHQHLIKCNSFKTIA